MEHFTCGTWWLFACDGQFRFGFWHEHWRSSVYEDWHARSDVVTVLLLRMLGLCDMTLFCCVIGLWLLEDCSTFINRVKTYLTRLHALMAALRSFKTSGANLTTTRLRWSRGSVLAFSTQVHGFKPGRSRRIFKGEKILSMPSFGWEVKPSVPCRRFAACKRSLNVTWKLAFRQNYRILFSSIKFHLLLFGSLASRRAWRHLAATVGMSKTGGWQGSSCLV
jgi:hypothetical protein